MAVYFDTNERTKDTKTAWRQAKQIDETDMTVRQMYFNDEVHAPGMHARFFLKPACSHQSTKRYPTIRRSVDVNCLLQ